MRQASSTSGKLADISRGILGLRPYPVKPKPVFGQGICPVPAAAADCLPTLSTGPAVTLTLVLLAAAAIVAGAALIVRRRSGPGSRRQQAVGEVLDAADALEARLRDARSEIEAVAGDDEADPVRDALREMLRQRLWLQQHGEAASLDELDAVRGSIDAARLRIEQQLLQIERARAPLH